VLLSNPLPILMLPIPRPASTETEASFTVFRFANSADEFSSNAFVPAFKLTDDGVIVAPASLRTIHADATFRMDEYVS
jgi:hypothetical protein